MTDAPLVRVEGLEKRYTTSDGLLERLLGTGQTVRAVDGVDLEIREGETVGLVGESGCGKTTLARLLVGLDEPSAGTVAHRGIDPSERSRRERRRLRTTVQYVFQNPSTSLNPRLPVADLVGEPLAVHDVVPPGRRDERIGELLETVGLEASHANRYPHEFSGGQRQRIAIARALAVEPELLVLDEPVSALDASVQARVLNLLADLQAEFDLSYLVVSHDLSVVEHVADRIAVMYLGRIVDCGTPAQLFDGGAHPYTEALLSAIPEPDPLWEGERIVLEGDVPSAIDPPSGCRFHTRCQKLIPPAGYDLDSDTTRGLVALRADLEDLAAGEASAGGPLEALRPSSAERETSGEPAETASVRRTYDLPSTLSDPDAEAELSGALEALAAGAVEEARSRLEAAFETPCESRRPELRPVNEAGSARRRIACHRFDDRFERRLEAGDDNRAPDSNERRR
ncbi:ABC transporter ATP-binding protein [Natrarchaeobius chitinivorans]|nr:ABC transporter ATP-binding protein [Natrarchaeobius chitinivorans]